MKVAIYARYSTELQNPRSVEDQIRVCSERAERENWKVYDCYSDSALSGTSMERPGLQQLLLDARECRFNIILAEALDRLSRDQADIAMIFKRMKFAGIDIVTLSEGRVGIVDVGLRGTMNQLFSIETANKVRRGQISRIKQGRPAGARRYGYDIIRKFGPKGELIRGILKINERKAEVIRRIYREYAAGKSPRAIAHRLNRDRIPGPVGKPWAKSTIAGDPRIGRGILNNEIYMGVFVYNRLNSVLNPETGKPVLRQNPESEWIRGEAPSMRIVDQQLWESVRERQRQRSHPGLAKLMAERKDKLRSRRRRFLLAGILKCGRCGASYVTRRYDKVSCFAYHNRGTCTNRLQIRRCELEDKVFSALKQHLISRPDRFAAFCEAYARQLEAVRKTRAELVDAYRSELAHLESEYDQLTDTPKRRRVHPDLETALESVVAKHRKFSHELDRLLKSPDPLERHYGEYVSEFVELANRIRHRPNSYKSFRSQIDRVVLTPNDKDTALLVDVKIVEDKDWRRRREAAVTKTPINVP